MSKETENIREKILDLEKKYRTSLRYIFLLTTCEEDMELITLIVNHPFMSAPVKHSLIKTAVNGRNDIVIKNVGGLWKR